MQNAVFVVYVTFKRSTNINICSSDTISIFNNFAVLLFSFASHSHSHQTNDKQTTTHSMQLAVHYAWNYSKSIHVCLFFHFLIAYCVICTYQIYIRIALDDKTVCIKVGLKRNMKFAEFIFFSSSMWL